MVEGYLETTLEVARNYLDLGALAEAEEHLLGLTSIRPDCIPALEGLAEVYDRQRRADLLRQTRLRLARAESAAGQHEAALEALKSVTAPRRRTTPSRRN